MHDPHDPGFGEGSQYAAHLDRGWQLFDKGNINAARLSATRARELNPDVPDASMLLATLAMAEGDIETALQHYDDAIDADPGYAEAHIAACQLLAFELDRPADARVRIQTARRLETIPIEALELGLLAAECDLGIDDVDAARRALDDIGDTTRVRIVLDPDIDAETRSEELMSLFGGRELLDLDSDEGLDAHDTAELTSRAVAFAVRLGRAWLDAARTKRALAWLEAACRRDPELAEGWAVLAAAYHASGDISSAARVGARALQLESRMPLPEWAPGAAELQQLLTDALKACGSTQPEVAALVEEGEIVLLIHELPPVELVLEGSDPQAIVMALGVARGDPAASVTPRPTLTAVAVYRRNLVRVAGHEDRMPTTLSAALEFELAHFFSPRRDAAH